MTLPELCIRRPVMTTLLMVSFVVVGIFGYRLLPVAALPRVDYPTINVTATLPGASPETMASSVAQPLERQFATIPGVDSITSTSGLGTTQITLQFDLNRDIDGAALDVQSAISTAARRLPIEMTTPPSFRKVDPADQPIMYIVVSSVTQPLSTVDEYAETLVAQRLSSLSGVAQVNVYGAQKYAVRVQVDPNALTAAGISLDAVQNALAAADSNAPLGTIEGQKQNYTIEASGQLGKAADYRKLIVAYRNGNPVRLGDVAQVLDSVENDQVASWYNGKRSIALAIQRQPDANTVAVVDEIKSVIPKLNAELPASVKLQVIVDRSISIRQSVSEVQFTLGLAVALVLLVIFLFLRNATATMIPALALPISIVGTFAGMYLFGYSIDNLSLLALTLSVGFVVDDAIVMLENIVRHIEAGEAPFDAALKGSREIAFTIISITISLVAVFIPVLFMGGVVGRLFHEFAVTIAMTILISGFVSLTLTPMLASRLLRHEEAHRHNALLEWSERSFERMRSLYDRSLQQALRHRKILLYVTLASIAATVVLFIVINKGFFPTEDTGLMFASTEASQDISFKQMAVLQQKVAAVIDADPAIAVSNSSIGVGGASGSLNAGRIFISLKPPGERAPISRVIERLRPKLAKIAGINTFLQPVQNINVGGRLSKSQYQLVLQGTDLNQVDETAPKLEDALKKIPGLEDVTSDLQIKSPQAFVNIDRQKAASMNVTSDEIRQTLYSAFGARQVATIYTPSNSYEVILELAPQYRDNLQALSKIYVPAADGTTLVPLDEVATIERTTGPVTVDHQGTLPSVLLSFNLAPGVSLGAAVERIDAAEQAMHLPATLSTSFQGTAQVFTDSLKGQGLLLLAAVFVIYVVLGILYESFVHPITILSGLPAAGIGALATLMLFGMDLDVISIIGLVMLIGIVKKNAIMMIDFALERQRNEGASPEQAIYQACLLRFRPIMMTTMAALMGTLPIAIGIGAGSELRRPLGVVVVGGLLLSQLLTLFITPVIYLYLDELRERLSEVGWRWRFGRKPYEAWASETSAPAPKQPLPSPSDHAAE